LKTTKPEKLAKTVTGVELNNNTASVEFPRNTTKMRSKSLKNWRNCGWSGTQQQHRKHESKRTVILKTSNPEKFAVKLAKLWLEWNSTTTQEARNRNTTNRDEKYRLEMSVQMVTTLV